MMFSRWKYNRRNLSPAMQAAQAGKEIPAGRCFSISKKNVRIPSR